MTILINPEKQMSTTGNLGQQALEVKQDLQEMGETVRDAAQEKLGQMGERASAYCEQGREKRRALLVPASNTSANGRCNPF